METSRPKYQLQVVEVTLSSTRQVRIEWEGDSFTHGVAMLMHLVNVNMFDRADFQLIEREGIGKFAVIYRVYIMF